MADHHHHHHRPHRLSVPSRSIPSTTPSRGYPLFPYPSPTLLTPTPTPSKHRLSHSLSSVTTPRPPSTSNNKSSFSFLFLLLFSLRSLYSLIPFLRASPSYSFFPFSFLVSLLSFILTFTFSLFPLQKKQRQAIFSFNSLTKSQIRILLSKSILMAVVFLLRFQALRYCGTAAMILAEFSGNIAVRFIVNGGNDRDRQVLSPKVRGFIALLTGLFLFSLSWDRRDCFPFSYSNLEKLGTSLILNENCVRIWPLLLPFLSGFLGYYERVSMNSVTIRQIGRKKVQLLALFFTTVLLFFPAAVSVLVFEAEMGSVSFENLAWPLANTVVFGVLLNEWYVDDKVASPNDFEKEFLVTFACTLALELVYFPELSLWGLLLCGFSFWVAVRQLNHVYSNYIELGTESSESVDSLIMKPIQHILSERKSRKIALFLMLNTGYMVVEFVAGFMSNSLGLISDACHMLFDCAALAIGLYASYIARLPANNQFNYGRGRFEVLSGYANAVFLVLVGALIVLESLERILDPQEISTSSLLTVSIGGLVVNVVGLIFFHEEHHHAHGGSCSHSHSSNHTDSHHEHPHLDKHSVHDHSSDCYQHKHECRDHSSDHHGHDHLHSNHDHNHGKDHHLHDHHCHEEHHLQNSHHHDCSGHESVQVTSSSSLHCNVLEGHKEGIPHVPRGQELSGRKEPVEPQKHHGHIHIDHNMEGIFLHVLADTLGSVGVVVSTLLIKYKGWLVADPAASIFISILIVSSVIPLLRNSAEILLQRVPRAHEQDLKEAITDIMRINGVCGIQNLHVWNLTNTDVVGTLHLHVSPETDEALTRTLVSHRLRDAGIKDLTLQVETVKGS